MEVGSTKPFLKKIWIQEIYPDIYDPRIASAIQLLDTLLGVGDRQNARVSVFLLSGESWQFSKHEIYSKNKKSFFGLYSPFKTKSKN